MLGSELREAASTGLWRVHLLAGGATPQQAAQVAGLLRASSDLAGLPYALLPARPAAAPPGRDPGRSARRSFLDEPALQWAMADSRQRAAAMGPYQAAPSVGSGSGLPGRTVAGAAASRPLLWLHGAGCRAGPGAGPGGAGPADGAAPAVRPDARNDSGSRYRPAWY